MIITGANTGIGYEDAVALYEKGATVIIAARSAGKIAQAIDRIKAAGGNGKLESALLDLSSFSTERTSTFITVTTAAGKVFKYPY